MPSIGNFSGLVVWYCWTGLTCLTSGLVTNIGVVFLVTFLNINHGLWAPEVLVHENCSTFVMSRVTNETSLQIRRSWKAWSAAKMTLITDGRTRTQPQPWGRPPGRPRWGPTSATCARSYSRTAKGRKMAVPQYSLASFLRWVFSMNEDFVFLSLDLQPDQW